MLPSERLESQPEIAGHLRRHGAVPLESPHEPGVGRGRVEHEVEERLAVPSGKDDPLMLVEHATGRLVGQIGRGTSRNGHGALNDSLGRRLDTRSEEHTSELQSLLRISYAVFCLKQKMANKNTSDTPS